MELEEELRVVGNNLKSLEVSEEKVRIMCWWIIRLIFRSCNVVHSKGHVAFRGVILK